MVTKTPRLPKPVVFADGEREELLKKVKKTIRKPVNSRTLAEKLDVPAHKLRQILYSLKRQGVVQLTPCLHRHEGMTVTKL